MSEHLPHDLPEYVPNWPVATRIRARVYRYEGAWAWGHECPRRGLARTFVLGRPQPSHQIAFAAALKHAQGCW